MNIIVAPWINSFGLPYQDYSVAERATFTAHGAEIGRINYGADLVFTTSTSAPYIADLDAIEAWINEFIPDVNQTGRGCLDWEEPALTVLYNAAHPQQAAQQAQYVLAINKAKTMRPNMDWGVYDFPEMSPFVGEEGTFELYNGNLTDLRAAVDIFYPVSYIDNRDGYYEKNLQQWGDMYAWAPGKPAAAFFSLWDYPVGRVARFDRQQDALLGIKDAAAAAGAQMMVWFWNSVQDQKAAYDASIAPWFPAMGTDEPFATTGDWAAHAIFHSERLLSLISGMVSPVIESEEAGSAGTLDNPGLSDPARDFPVTRFIPQPIEDLDTPIMLSAPFAIELVRVWRRTQDGNCDVTFYIDDEIVEFDDAESSGVISADEGELNTTIPDSTDPLNSIVPAGGRFSYMIDNASTPEVGLELQIDCRRAQ